MISVRSEVQVFLGPPFIALWPYSRIPKGTLGGGIGGKAPDDRAAIAVSGV